MGVWTSQDINLLAALLRVEAEHPRFPAGVEPYAARNFRFQLLFKKEMKQDKNKIVYILRELQIFVLVDETIYLRKHRVGHVERMTNDHGLINHEYEREG